ncbi:nuclear transport factor 2 family protein [Massilia niabensis]|uniref:Nuclear transport factor 2 family protein n=1 Tax=Massilia niabensis TaxID=544910 RepID=A0ABW0LB26_9BURK
MMNASDSAVQKLLAHEDIRHCLMRYARAIDRCDPELLGAVYWPEATDSHGSFEGTAAAFIDWVIPLLRAMDQTMHLLGNILIELEGDKAAVETYFTAYHRIRRHGGEPYDVIVSGRYIDRMECRNGEWRIGERRVVYDWVREFEDSSDWSKPVLGLRFESNRIENDPSYTLFGAARPIQSA